MPTFQGFLPTRGSYVLDAVFVAMFAIILFLVVNILLAKKGKFRLHRSLQIALSIILLVAIIIFEIDVRFFTNWRQLAEPSRFYADGWVDWAMAIHLTFAIPTPFVWGYVIYQAVRKFPSPAAPSAHSQSHKTWGWIAAGMMFATCVTGCIFYWLSFAC